MRKTIGSFAVNAAVIAAVLLIYLLLLSPVSVMTLSGSSAFPAYYGCGEGVSLLIPVSWDASSVGRILDELDESGVRVTFAVTRGWAEGAPKLLSRMAKRGHELAIIAESDGEDIGSALDAVERISGIRPALIYTGAGEGNASAAGAHGLTPVAGTLDLDCGRGTALEISARLADRVKDGVIITAEPTEAFAEALPLLLEKIKKLGIPIVSIHKMLYN